MTYSCRDDVTKCIKKITLAQRTTACVQNLKMIRQYISDKNQRHCRKLVNIDS